MHDNYNPDDIDKPKMIGIDFSEALDSTQLYLVTKSDGIVEMNHGFVAVPVDDKRFHHNFETALAALIEHHGADALTALTAFCGHYDMILTISNNGFYEAFHAHKKITANDIKPEK